MAGAPSRSSRHVAVPRRIPAQPVSLKPRIRMTYTGLYSNRHVIGSPSLPSGTGGVSPLLSALPAGRPRATGNTGKRHRTPAACNARGYALILRFRSRALRRLYERDDARGIRAGHAKRLRRILTLLDVAREPRDVDCEDYHR